MKDEKDHWLVRPETIRKLWILLIVICAATERNASTIMPSISAVSWSGWKVRRPSVCEARNIAASSGRTEA